MLGGSTESEIVFDDGIRPDRHLIWVRRDRVRPQLHSDAGRASEWAEFIDVVTQYLEDSGLDYRQPLGLT